MVTNTTPEAWGVWYPEQGGDTDTVLCGLGGGEIPGVVWPAPPAVTLTPTPTPEPTPTPTPVRVCDQLGLLRCPSGGTCYFLQPNSSNNPYTVCPCDQLNAGVEVVPADNTASAIDLGGENGTVIGGCDVSGACQGGQFSQFLLVSGPCDYAEGTVHTVTVAAKDSRTGTPICTAKYYVSQQWDGLTCNTYCRPSDPNAWVYQKETCCADTYGSVWDAQFCPSSSEQYQCTECPNGHEAWCPAPGTC